MNVTRRGFLVAAGAACAMLAACDSSSKEGTESQGRQGQSVTTSTNEEKQKSKPVDKSGLEAKIQSSESLVQEDYTSETWEPFYTALNNARAVDADESATQRDVDSAKKALESASSSLKEAFRPESYEPMDYTAVARTPDDYKGTKVVTSGRVIQVIEGKSETDLRVATDGKYGDVVLVAYDQDIMDGTHVLEDDTVTVYGTCIGTTTYTSTMGGKITIPAVVADHVDIG